MLPQIIKNNIDEQMDKERYYLVVKSNSMVRTSKYNLSTQEQKVILYIISKIKPDDTEFNEQVFNLKDLCNIFGIEYNSKNYINFRNAIQNLSDKSFWIEKDNKEILVRWLEYVSIDKDNMTVSVKLNHYLEPYLLGAYVNTTQYLLHNILAMRSKYSIRLYELMKSYAYLKKVEIELSTLKKLLSLENNKYPVYKDFRVRVLEPAIDEINKYTEIKIQITPIRTKQAITSILFTIKNKTKAEFQKARLEIDKQLFMYEN